MGAGKRLGRGLMPARLPHGEVETLGHATNILFGFRMSFIYDTYRVLTWNKRIKRGPGARSSSD